jgi:porin
VGALLVAGCLPTAALAQERNTLTGDWGGLRTQMAQGGVTIRGDVTGFANGLIGGTGDKVWDAFGRYDVLADIDFGKAGLIKGLGVHVHGEGRFGKGQTNFGGQIFPANTGAVIPLGGEAFAASSLYLTQSVGNRTVVMLGKINAVDLLAADPVLGGWGTQRFQNIAFVAPPSGVVPPTIMGGIIVHKGTPITLTMMVFDPNDRTRDYLPGDLFKSGVNVTVGGTWTGKLAGRATSVGLSSTVSTKRGLNLEDILVPPGFETDSVKGSYNISLQFTHRLIESRQVDGKGLDLVIKGATADGNPNIVESSLVVALAGHGLIPGRPADSFGVGAFSYNFSNALQSTVNPLADFKDEQGVEAWYSFAVTRFSRLSASIQVINPADGSRPIVAIGGARLSIGL